MLFIRSHTWGDPERRILEQMQSYFGSDIVLTLDATQAPAPPSLPVPVVEITPSTMMSCGIAAPQDWGWRCGDFFLYAGAAAFPGYDHYWMVEPDVVFNKLDVPAYFRKFEKRPEDFLASYIGPREAKWMHHAPASAYFTKIFGCVFPLIRLSGRAVSLLQAARGAHVDRPENPRAYVNDEAFVASTLCQTPGFSYAALNTITPNLLSLKTFNTAMIFLDEECPNLPAGVYHPVMSAAELSRKLPRKLGVRSSFDHYSPRFHKYLSADDNDKFYATMLRRLSRDHAAPYRTERDLPRIRAEKAVFPHAMIVERRKIPRGERVGPLDFRVSPPTYTERIDLTRMAPYYWSAASDQVILVDSPLPQGTPEVPFSTVQCREAVVVATTTAARLRADLPVAPMHDPLFVLMRGVYSAQDIIRPLMGLNVPAYLSCQAIDSHSLPPGVAISETAVAAIRTIVQALMLHGGEASVAIGIDTEVVRDPGIYLRAFPRAPMLYVAHPLEPWLEWCSTRAKLSADEVFDRLLATLQCVEQCRDHSRILQVPGAAVAEAVQGLLSGDPQAATSLTPQAPAYLPEWLAARLDHDDLAARMTAAGLLEA